MIRDIIVRLQAEAELTEAFEWYEQRVSGLGGEFLDSVDAIFDSISRSPRQCPVVHNTIRRALTRRFPYEVFFVEEDERIVILAVFHAKRNPKIWRERS
jgi:plasmid stabilization system protein ParE